MVLVQSKHPQAFRRVRLDGVNIGKVVNTARYAYIAQIERVQKECETRRVARDVNVFRRATSLVVKQSRSEGVTGYWKPLLHRKKHRVGRIIAPGGNKANKKKDDDCQ